MGLLLYKSDEMYSSTELIRKSKMIGYHLTRWEALLFTYGVSKI